MTATTTDWEKIEREFVAGVLSLREIGKRHGVTEGAVRKRAKRDRWTRDLAARVQEKVRATLVRDSSTQRPERDARTEREIVEEAAATTVYVVRSHRTRIARLWTIADGLESRLASVATDVENITLLIAALAKAEEELGQDHDSVHQRAREAIRKLLTTGDHVRTYRDLANAVKTVVDLERQAFGILDGQDDGKDTYEDRLERLAAAGEDAAA